MLMLVGPKIYSIPHPNSLFGGGLFRMLISVVQNPILYHPTYACDLKVKVADLFFLCVTWLSLRFNSLRQLHAAAIIRSAFE